MQEFKADVNDRILSSRESMDHNFTLIRGDIAEMRKDIKDLRTDVDKLRVDVDEIRSGIEVVNLGIASHNARFSYIETIVKNLDYTAQAFRNRFQYLEEDLTSVKQS